MFYTEVQQIISDLMIRNVTTQYEKNYVFKNIPQKYKNIKTNIAYTQQNVFKENNDFYKAQMQLLKSIFFLSMQIMFR